MAAIGGIGAARHRMQNENNLNRSASNLPAAINGTGNVEKMSGQRSGNLINDIMKSKDLEVEQNERDRQRELNKPGHKLRLLVESHSFTTPVAVLIMLNGVMIGAEADYNFDNMGSGWKTFNTVQEYFFTTAFSLELAVKIVAFRVDFFIGHDWGWNIMDFFLVGLSFIETFILSQLSGGSSSMSQMSVLRMLRLLRLVRLVRLLKAFQQLWFLVVGIIKAMPVTFWGLLLTTFVVYMAAIFTTKQLRDVSDEDGIMDEYFGNVPRSMFTLFQVTTGDSWASAIVRPVMKEQPEMVIFFILFVCLTQFAVLNVVVAVIVEAVLKEAGQTDLEFLAKCEEELRNTLYNIYAAFLHSDENQDGTLTKEEYIIGLNNPLAIAELTKVGINIEEAEEMFDVVDKDRSGHVTPEEFINGCLRGRGSARAKDVLVMSASVRKCVDMLKKLLELSLRRDGEMCVGLEIEKELADAHFATSPTSSNGRGADETRNGHDKASNCTLGCSKSHARAVLSRVEDHIKDVRGALDSPCWNSGLPVEVLEALAVIETRLVQIGTSIPQEQKDKSDELRSLAQCEADSLLEEVTSPGIPLS